LADGSTDVPDHTTIRSRLESSFYKSIDHLLSDLDNLTSSLSDPSKDEYLPNGSGSSTRQSVESDLKAQATEFKSYVLDRLSRSHTKAKPSVSNDKEKHDRSVTPQLPQRENRAVLTLYGNAHNIPFPRQVFSSLQQPKNSPSGASTEDVADEVFIPVREAALPNGITASNVLPFHPPEPADTKKAVPTFGECFAPPSSIAQLVPPSQSRRTTTRGSTVGWYNPGNAEASQSVIHTTQGTRTNYKQSQLHSGQWLNKVTKSSPDTNRSSDDGVGISPQTLDMFRKAYSGFAPSRDNSQAIIPEDIKDNLWWIKVGKERLRKYVAAIAKEENVENGMMEESLPDEAADDDKLFEQAVNDYKPATPPKEFRDPDEMETEETGETQDIHETDKLSKSGEELLAEIAGLITTLASHQRIRNLSLAPSPRTGATSSQSSATDPSDSEVEVYEMLKDQLALMIEMLPPHAISRLDGDKLKDLNISPNVLVENANYRGTLQEDDYTLHLLRQNSAANTAPRPTSSSYGTNPRAPPYQTSTPQLQYNQRPGYAPSPSARPGQGYQPLNYPGRPMSSAQYSGQPQPYQNRPMPSPSGAPRPSFPPNQYSQSQPNAPQYGQSGNQQGPRPIQNGHHITPLPNGTPTPSQSYPGRPQPPTLAQRPSEGTSGTPDPRSASPQKQPPNTLQQNQQQNSYGATANSTNPPRYFPQPPHHPSQYGQNPPVKSPPGAMSQSDADLTSRMLATHAAILKDSSGPQQSPQPMRQASETPQPPNGLQIPQRTATPGGGQQNGTAVKTEE
jgi:hypothetical protein